MRFSSVTLVLALVVVPVTVVGAPATAQEPAGTITGTVVDSVSGEPIADAEVTLVRVDGSTVGTTRSDRRGGFRFSSVPAGRYEVRVRRVGYAASVVEVTVGEAGSATVRAALRGVLTLAELRVETPSRGGEPWLTSPSATTPVDADDIAAKVLLTPVDAVRAAPGFDISNKGIIQSTFAVRGDRSASSGAMLMLTDYRYAGVPSLGFNVAYLVPTAPDDIERIEVVRGPGSALYGPNAHRGVLHIVTRSPFDATGGSIALSGGERSLVQGTGRGAARLSNHVAVKVSGDYVRADDWEYVDPEDSLPRDLAIERAAAEGRLDWRSAADSTAVTVSTRLGWAQAFNLVDAVSAVGGVQVHDWRYSYVQTRLTRGSFSANAMYNWSDAGQSFLLRSGSPLVDNSRVAAVQVQHGTRLGGRHDLGYGVDARYTEPRTGGTIHGRYENDDEIAELGAYLQGRARVVDSLDLIAAVRVDYHDRLGDVVWSPRLGIVWQPRTGHALRLTYNRAFNSPDPGDLFPDVVVGSLRPLVPYDVRLLGTPTGGFHFRRDGALCMRSPFVPDPTACLPPDATATWPAVVMIAADSFRVDLSDVPQPDATQVGTVFGVLDIESEIFGPADVNALSDIAPDRRTITTAVEAGYKGLIAGALLIAVDVYHNWVKDAFGPRYVATPNAFYDSVSLASYLEQFRPPDAARVIAGVIGQVPAGTVTPWESGMHDLLVFEPQGGTVTFWGVDVAVTAELGPTSVSASYSWVSDDSIPNVAVAGSYVLNGPRNKGSAGVTYRDRRSRFRAGIEGRLVSSFPVVSGRYSGRVDEYGVVDVRLGASVPGLRGVDVSLDALNVLDNRHQEFVGAPEIGRLLIARVRATF